MIDLYYKNIEMFMMKEKTNNYFLELNNQEYKQLKVFNALTLFEKTYKKLQKKNKSFSKIDVMWSVYNELALKYEYTKDTIMLSIVLERETEILMDEKKYIQALDTYLCSLYCLFYDYKIISNSDIDLFDRHLNNRRTLKFKDLISKNNISNDDIINNFQFIISNNIHSLYDEEKAKFIIKNILRRIEL